MQSLEHRRYYSSLVLLYKCMNSNGPQYIKNFFQTRYTKYILRSRGITLEQSGYNNKSFHNSFTYIVSRLWNKLPAHIETSSKFSEFTRNLETFDFSKLGPSCHCNSCIYSFISICLLTVYVILTFNIFHIVLLIDSFIVLGTKHEPLARATGQPCLT